MIPSGGENRKGGEGGRRGGTARHGRKPPRAVQSGHPRGHRGIHYQSLRSGEKHAYKGIDWYEAPTYDTSLLDRFESLHRNRSAVGAGPADRRMAPFQRTAGRAGRAGCAGPADRGGPSGSGPKPTSGARRFLPPTEPSSDTDN